MAEASSRVAQQFLVALARDQDGPLHKFRRGGQDE